MHEIPFLKKEKKFKFFYPSTVMRRRRRNNIEAIRNNKGAWIRSRGDLVNYFICKFEELFAHRGGSGKGKFYSTTTSN